MVSSVDDHGVICRPPCVTCKPPCVTCRPPWCNVYTSHLFECVVFLLQFQHVSYLLFLVLMSKQACILSTQLINLMLCIVGTSKQSLFLGLESFQLLLVTKQRIITLIVLNIFLYRRVVFILSVHNCICQVRSFQKELISSARILPLEWELKDSEQNELKLKDSEHYQHTQIWHAVCTLIMVDLFCRIGVGIIFEWSKRNKKSLKKGLEKESVERNWPYPCYIAQYRTLRNGTN